MSAQHRNRMHPDHPTTAPALVGVFVRVFAERSGEVRPVGGAVCICRRSLFFGEPRMSDYQPAFGLFAHAQSGKAGSNGNACIVGSGGRRHRSPSTEVEQARLNVDRFRRQNRQHRGDVRGPADGGTVQDVRGGAPGPRQWTLRDEEFCDKRRQGVDLSATGRNLGQESGLTQVRCSRSSSWLDPEAGMCKGARLGERLITRCKGHRGLFVTLTYDRSNYADGLDLYRDCQDGQHVPLFIRRLERRIGQSLRGKWICKAEFQTGGWLHFHLIILDIDRIDHSVCAEAWGHGFVWLKRLTPRRIRYTCKYVAKGGSIPAWVYGERERSFKVIRTSRDFWKNEPQRRRDDWGDWRPQKIAAYVPCGARIKAMQKGVMARQDGHYGYLGVSWTILVSYLSKHRFILVDSKGWLVLTLNLADLRRHAHAAAREAGRGVHLKHLSDPDADPFGPSGVHAWYSAHLMEEAA